MTPNCRTYAGICPRWQSIPSNSQNLARDTGRKYSEPICNPQPSPQSPSLNSQPVIPTSSSQHNSPPKSLFPAVPQAAMPAPDVVYTADESSSITLQTGSSVDNTTKNDVRYGRRICYPALISRTHSHINRWQLAPNPNPKAARLPRYQLQAYNPSSEVFLTIILFNLLCLMAILVVLYCADGHGQCHTHYGNIHLVLRYVPSIIGTFATLMYVSARDAYVRIQLGFPNISHSCLDAYSYNWWRTNLHHHKSSDTLPGLRFPDYICYLSTIGVATSKSSIAGWGGIWALRTMLQFSMPVICSMIQSLSWIFQHRMPHDDT